MYRIDEYLRAFNWFMASFVWGVGKKKSNMESLKTNTGYRNNIIHILLIGVFSS